MRVLVLYDHVDQAVTPDQADTLAQSRAVTAALESLGHEWMTLGITLDLDAARTALQRLQPDLVFNLVESLDGQGRFIHMPLHLLDSLHIPYTGVTAEGMVLTTNKLLSKRQMKFAGVPTPEWFTIEELRKLETANAIRGFPQQPVIIKSVWEHASIGLDDDAIIEPTSAEHLCSALEQRLDLLGGDGFAEQFIDGREFNLALLSTTSGEPEFLPPCEIIFEGFDDDQPRIVNYNAKWNEDSFEYGHTPRRYDFPTSDQPLIERMKAIAMECWRLFDLRGHARVDFRVDQHGNPWVLEVNANPCLSSDAGFAAALDRAGIPYVNAIERIVADALRYRRQDRAFAASH